MPGVNDPGYSAGVQFALSVAEESIQNLRL
jgi:hypothetical protein